MAIYRYEAVDKSGKTLRGAMNAADEQDLAQRLTSMGYALRSVMPAGATTQQQSAASTSAGAPGRFPVSVAPSVSLRAISRYYRQLATLVRAGMSPGLALSDLTSSTANRKIREASSEITRRVQGGESLSSAMASFPYLFPVHTVGLIWAGEQGGYLDTALDEASTELEQEVKDGFVASVGWFVSNLNVLGLVLVLPIWNVGALFRTVANESMKQSAGTDLGSMDLPRAARIVRDVYIDGFLHKSIPALIAWIVLYYVWKRLKRMPQVRRVIDSVLLGMPLWGTLHKARARERFLKSLYSQYNAGVPTAQAWAAASMTVRNSEYSSRLRNLDDMLRRPEGNLQRALLESKVFTADDAGMVGTGERAGSVPEMLEQLSSYHSSVAAGSKLKGRVVAVHALILALIIPSGYLVIKVVSDFLQVFKEFAGLK